MSLDGYSICPCGSGKKVKFCCCKDMLAELDKVMRMMEGDQRASATDALKTLLADKGPRAALLALLAEVHLSLEQLEDADKVNDQLLEQLPHSPVGNAISSVLDVIEGDTDAAIEDLQEALENVDQQMPQVTYSAIGILAQALLAQGRFYAARGHLLMQAGISGGKDEAAIETLVRMNGVVELPPIIKQDFQYGECPEDAKWKGEFHAAMHSAARGAWRAACETLESLDQKVPQQACVWRCIAILRGWLGQYDAAVAAWRKYETLPGVAEDDAIEAEALAQILAHQPTDDTTELINVTYPIRDTERLMELLLSNHGASPLAAEDYDGEEGQPRPKAGFELLDRGMPEWRDDMTVADLPVVLADCWVFGRQTDREARLELQIERTPSGELAKQRLVAIVGEQLGLPTNEVVLKLVSLVALSMSAPVRFPKSAPPDRVGSLIDQLRRDIYLQRWPEISRVVFNGQTARVLAADSQLRIRVLAAILNLELMTEQHPTAAAMDFNDLRTELGLPRAEKIVASGDDVKRLPLARWNRLDLARLSDDDLVSAYRMRTLKGTRASLRRTAQELVSRPNIGDKIDLVNVYQMLVQVSADSDEALQHIERGRREGTAKGYSPATWYLLELQVRFSRYELEECNRLTRILATRHAEEPGIAESLFRVLERYGVVGPDGSMPGTKQSAAPALEPAAAVGGLQLWTPDSAAAPKQESKLWLPGT